MLYSTSHFSRDIFFPFSPFVAMQYPSPSCQQLYFFSRKRCSFQCRWVNTHSGTHDATMGQGLPPPTKAEVGTRHFMWAWPSWHCWIRINSLREETELVTQAPVQVPCLWPLGASSVSSTHFTASAIPSILAQDPSDSLHAVNSKNLQLA